MEADAVQAVVLADLDDPFPTGDIGRRITGQWKIPAGMRRADFDRPAVEKHRSIVGFDLPQAEGESALIVGWIASELQRQVLKIGVIFIPGLGVVAKRNG